MEAGNYRDRAEKVREDDKGVEAVQKETRMSLAEYLKKNFDSSEKKDIESAVKEAANVLRRVWGRTINIKDLYLETFADPSQLGAATPGDKSAGISLSMTLMHPFCRAKFIETLVHEGHHMLGNLDGEEGETVVRYLTANYSDMVQSQGFEEGINAMKEIADLFELGDSPKGLREMADMYTNEPGNMYMVFLRKFCQKHGISPFAFWYYRKNPFNTGEIFSPKDEKGELKIPQVAQQGYELFKKAFPELTATLTRSVDGDIDLMGVDPKDFAPLGYAPLAANDNAEGVATQPLAA